MSASARGIILAREGEQLVIQATAAEVAKFAAGERVGVAPSPSSQTQEINAADLIAHGFLYDRHGQRVAIVDSVVVTQPKIAVTAFGDPSDLYVAGRMSVNITARGIA